MYGNCFAECFGCRKLFNFHPNHVPSVLVNEEREPICRDCVERVNPLRKDKGLEPIEIDARAYDIFEEHELIY